MKKINLHQCIWYFFIYSICGMLLENVFCFVTSFHIESRKGLLFGPFCPIYGIGSILLTIFLEPCKDNKYKVLGFGLIIGTVFEYISSYLMQGLCGVKFWNYSNNILNLNGRTCLYYALCWGILSAILIYYSNPKINKLIKLFEYKSLDIILLIYMLLNAIITYNSVVVYVNRTEHFLKNETTEMASYKLPFITDDVMKIVFPNIIYVIDDNREILIYSIYKK